MAPVPPLGLGTPGNRRFTRKKYIGFGETFGVAGLAAEDDRQLLLRRRLDRCQRGRFTRRLHQRLCCGEPGSVSGQPVQRGRVEAIDQARQQPGFLLRQRDQRTQRFGGHGKVRLDVYLTTES